MNIQRKKKHRKWPFSYPKQEKDCDFMLMLLASILDLVYAVISQNLFSKSCCFPASHKSGASLPPAVDLRGEILTHLTNQPYHEMHLDRFDD